MRRLIRTTMIFRDTDGANPISNEELKETVRYNLEETDQDFYILQTDIREVDQIGIDFDGDPVVIVSKDISEKSKEDPMDKKINELLPYLKRYERDGETYNIHIDSAYNGENLVVEITIDYATIVSGQPYLKVEQDCVRFSNSFVCTCLTKSGFSMAIDILGYDINKKIDGMLSILKLE